MGVLPQPTGKRILLLVLLLAIIALAATLRLVDLANRPMHCDEAVHADKFGALLERNFYKYDPHEYHGPTLNYLTLPVAWLSKSEQLTQVTETQLRLVPAIFGILLVGLVWLLRRDLGWAATIWVALLTAISPAMVFYSRYYIQEMLLVCFTFVALVAWWRFLRCAKPCDHPPGDRAGKSREGEAPAEPQASVIRQSNPPKPTPDQNRPPRRTCLLWLILLGVSIALMHASKETCIIALFSLAVGSLTVTGYLWRIGVKRLAIALPIVLVAAACISPLLFSSFGKNWDGVYDSFATYHHYFARATGEGTAEPTQTEAAPGVVEESPRGHVYPWYHHFRVLFWWQKGSGPLWTEGMIAVLAVVGLVAGLSGVGLASCSDDARPEAADSSASKAPATGPPSVFGRILQWFNGPPQIALVRLLAVYTIAITLVYSAIPYKTPWSALGFLHGMILLAGIGAAVLVRIAPGFLLKGVMTVALIAASGQLAFQAYRANFEAYEDRDNPYVYAHTASDVPAFVEKIREIALLHPDGMAMHVQVICPNADYWPLPWYMRDFSQVGWYGGEPRGPGGELIEAAPVMIFQPTMRDVVLNYNYYGQPEGTFVCVLGELPPKTKDRAWLFRPGVRITAFVEFELLGKHQAEQE